MRRERGTANLLRCVGPFLKEFVKGRWFSSGLLHNGSAGRRREFFRFVGRADPCLLLVVTVSGFVSVVVATGSCDRSLPTRLLPTHSFARYRSRPIVSSSARLNTLQMPFIWCEFLTVRATPYTATCGQASTLAGEKRRIQGPTRVGPNGRDLKLPQGNSDRTTGPKLHSSSLLSGVFGSTTTSGRLQ